VVNKDMILKAMDRIEALLEAVEKVCAKDTESNRGQRPTIGEIEHGINNARQIAAAVKVLLEETP
jgi:hypothetical protein